MSKIINWKRRKDIDFSGAIDLDLIREREDGTFLVTLPSRGNEVLTVPDYTTARILEESERVLAVLDRKRATA